MTALAALLVTPIAHAANWGEFQKDFCRGVSPPIRQYSAILWNIPWGYSWEDACKVQPADILGYHFNNPSRCVDRDYFDTPLPNIWGEFDVPDQTCYLDMDALAAQFLIPYTRPHYCDPTPAVEIDGCSVPITDPATRSYKDIFYKACAIHDYCYAMPDNSKDFCDNTFYDQMMSIAGNDVFGQTVASTWYQFVQILGKKDYKWANGHCTVFDWTSIPGRATDIGIGADGSVWIIGTDRASFGGYKVFRWGGMTWEAVDSPGAVAIDVGTDGQPWIVDEYGNIFQRTSDAWIQVSGPGQAASDIGIGADGSVWIIANGIYKWTGAGWSSPLSIPGSPLSVSGKAIHIDVGPDGDPWVVSDNGAVLEWNGSFWKVHSHSTTAADIGIDADGNAWIVDGDHQIHRKGFGKDNWMTVLGKATRISGGSLGGSLKGILAGVVDSDGNIFLGTQRGGIPGGIFKFADEPFIYYSNGQGYFCWYDTWEHYVSLTGNPGWRTQDGRLSEYNMTYGGICRGY